MHLRIKLTWEHVFIMIKPRSSNEIANNKTCLYCGVRTWYIFHGHILKTSLRANKSAGRDEAAQITSLPPPQQNGFTLRVSVRQYHQIRQQIIKGGKYHQSNLQLRFFTGGEGADGGIMFPSMTQCFIERGSFSLYFSKVFCREGESKVLEGPTLVRKDG